MVAQQAAPLDIDPTAVGTLELEGAEVPYVDLEDWPAIHTRLHLNGVEYSYDRSFPIKGHSAVMPQAVDELRAAGKRILVIERSERYCVYVG